MIATATYVAARYLLNISTPERDWRLLTRVWRYDVMGFIKECIWLWQALRIATRFALFDSRQLFVSTDLKLQELQRRVRAGEFADDTAGG